MNYLGIDIGTSFIKAALLDLEKLEIKEVKKVKGPDILSHENPRAKEYDIGEIYRTVFELIESYKHYSLSGIVFSTQMHGFVLTDTAGKSVTNYISWEDERASETVPEGGGSYKDAVYRLLEGEDIANSGMQPMSGYAICSLYYLLRKKLVSLNENLVFCTLGDYVASRLTGEQPRSHMTNAAATGLMDLLKGGWNRGAIAKLGFSGVTFPKIVQENHICGFLQLKGHKVPVFPAVGDHQAAVLGTAATPLKDLSINIGTGSQMSLIGDKLEFGEYQTRPFFEGSFLKTIPSIPAGRALNVLVNFIGGIARDFFEAKDAQLASLWRQIDHKAAGFHGSDLEVKISFFESSLKESRGVINNISEANLTVENLFYAAYTNMAENFYMLYKQLISRGAAIERIILSGGMAGKNKLLQRLISKKFGLETVLCSQTEDTIAGLFQIALKCAGYCTNLGEARAMIARVKVI